LEFNQSEERKPISGSVNFALIGQNPIQFQFQSLVWYRLKPSRWVAVVNWNVDKRVPPGRTRFSKP